MTEFTSRIPIRGRCLIAQRTLFSMRPSSFEPPTSINYPFEHAKINKSQKSALGDFGACALGETPTSPTSPIEKILGQKLLSFYWRFRKSYSRRRSRSLRCRINEIQLQDFHAYQIVLGIRLFFVCSIYNSTVYYG
jgi:hypothetical protein